MRGARFISDLRIEHAEHARMLTVLSREVGPLTRSASRTLPLIREVMEFIREHLDRSHHGREDRLFKRLAARRPLRVAALNRLNREHKRLSRASERITHRLIASARLLEGAKSPNAPKMRRLARDIDRFVEQSRAHIEREEQVFFSGAITALTAADWRAILDGLTPEDQSSRLQPDRYGPYPVLQAYLNQTSPYFISSGSRRLVERMRLSEAGVLYGNFVGRSIEAAILALRQHREALGLAWESLLTVCTPRLPDAYAEAIRDTYRTDADALARWTREWRDHLRWEPLTGGRSPRRARI